MINDTRPRLAITIAGYSQANRTCDRRHVSVHDGGSGGLLLRIVLICCFVTVTCGTKSMLYGKNFKELLAVLPPKNPPQHSQMGYCDLDTDCDWFWNETQGFKKVKASRTSSSRFFPTTDASNSSNGTKALDRSYIFFMRNWHEAKD